jgi:hypothetical protein
LHKAIEEKAQKFADVVKIGRTHLMDATPLTLGREMSGWASLLERDVLRLRDVLPGQIRSGHRRNGGWDRPECASGIRRARREQNLGIDSPAVPLAPEQIRSAFISRRDRFRQPRAQNAGSLADEDRQ